MVSPFTTVRKEQKKEKEGRNKERRPRARKVFGKSGRLLFLLFAFGAGLVVSMLQLKDCREGRRMMERMQQQEVQVKGNRWVEEIPQRWKQPNGEDRTEMKKKRKRG